MEVPGVVRKPTIVLPEQGRVYAMGRMRAVFKADRDESADRDSAPDWFEARMTDIASALGAEDLQI